MEFIVVTHFLLAEMHARVVLEWRLAMRRYLARLFYYKFKES
jgi:hypothetical protein